MPHSHIGEFAALLTVFCWTVSALSFEYAGKKIGSLSLNFIRLVMGVGLLSIFLFITKGTFIPLHSSGHVWFWLTISGIVGYGIGDLLLFQAFVVVGARISMLMMALSPPITALIGGIFLGERLNPADFIGMILTIAGVSIVIFQKSSDEKSIKFTHSGIGILLAFGSAFFQAVGLVISKYGIASDSAINAALIRGIAGTIAFALIITIARKTKNIIIAVKNINAMKITFLGAFFGPFIGVSLSLFAVQHTATGIASTIMSIVPVFIIGPSVIFFKEKVTLKELIGAIIAVSGVGILFL
ncbi:DMT family transporter [bacterium]|nr:DMT family transporter [bacterium]